MLQFRVKRIKTNQIVFSFGNVRIIRAESRLINGQRSLIVLLHLVLKLTVIIASCDAVNNCLK